MLQLWHAHQRMRKNKAHRLKKNQCCSIDFDPQNVKKTEFIKIYFFKTIHRVGCTGGLPPPIKKESTSLWGPLPGSGRQKPGVAKPVVAEGP